MLSDPHCLSNPKFAHLLSLILLLRLHCIHQFLKRSLGRKQKQAMEEIAKRKD